MVPLNRTYGANMLAAVYMQPMGIRPSPGPSLAIQVTPSLMSALWQVNWAIWAIWEVSQPQPKSWTVSTQNGHYPQVCPNLRWKGASPQALSCACACVLRWSDFRKSDPENTLMNSVQKRQNTGFDQCACFDHFRWPSFLNVWGSHQFFDHFRWPMSWHQRIEPD